MDLARQVLRRFLAREWDTKEEMQQYLREHDEADPSKHRVKSPLTKLRHKILGPSEKEQDRDFAEKQQELKTKTDRNNERINREFDERMKSRK